MSRTYHHAEHHKPWFPTKRNVLRRYQWWHGRLHAPASYRRTLNRLLRARWRAALTRDTDDPWPRGRWRRVCDYDWF